MPSQLKPLLLIPMLLVATLATIGLCVGYWQETLAIDDNVNTGELKLEFVDVEHSDNDPVGYDVGKVTWELLDEGRTLNIDIQDAYPGYTVTVSFKVKNTGTIPATIYDVEFDDGIPYWAEVGFNQLWNLEGQTLEPNDWRPISITVNIYEEDKVTGEPCPENYPFDFTVTIQAKQWNY